MSSIADGIRWRGPFDVMLSMFVVYRSGNEGLPTMTRGTDVPTEIRVWRLEDDQSRLVGYNVVEYDAVFPDLPKELAAYLTFCLDSALRQGAVVAWFGYEGGFDFDYLLTSEMTESIYAIADGGGIEVATDASIHTIAWTTRVMSAMRRLTAET